MDLSAGSLCARFTKNISYKLSFLLLALTSQSLVFASTYNGAIGETRVTTNTSQVNDYMVISPANSEGVSVNTFGTFQVQGKDLIIYNGTSDLDGAVENYADTIVIEAASIDLQGNIQIVGEPANLLFISTSSQDLNCTNCQINNVNRLTFVKGQMSHAQNIGVVNSAPVTNGAININGLTSPGLLSLELIGQHIRTSGDIDLNVKVKRHPAGGYSVADDGNLVGTTGGINIYSGEVALNYTDLELISIKKDTGSLVINGGLKAGAIAVTSGGDMAIASSTAISTLSDLVVTSTLPDKGLHVQQQGIFISSYTHPNETAQIQGTLSSDHDITIRVNSTLEASGTILTKNLTLGALEGVITKGNIQAQALSVAAGLQNDQKTSAFYRNSGNINVSTLNIETEGNIFNSHGGQITANSVNIISQTGTFINGSRSKDFDQDLLPLPTSIDKTSTHWGIYHSFSTAPSSPANTNLKAQIIANNISIQAVNIENINPYFLLKGQQNWDAGISINTDQANQVSIQAENSLKLKASNYIMNVSGIIGLNQAGQFSVNAKTFNNERYRLDTTQVYLSEVLLSDKSGKEHFEYHSGAANIVTAYSAPGRIYSFGNFQLSDGNNQDENEVFNNFTSYFEVFQDAEFHQLEISSIGLDFGAREVISGREIICLLRNECERSNVITQTESETLFSVQGSVKGINGNERSFSDLNIDTLNVLEQKRRERAETYLESLHYDYYTTEGYVTYDGRDDGEENARTWAYVRNVNITSTMLSYSYTTCIHFFELDRVEQCITKAHTKLLSDFDDKSDTLSVPGTGLTIGEIEQASKAYVASRSLLPMPDANQYPEYTTNGHRIYVDRRNTYINAVKDGDNIIISYSRIVEYIDEETGEDEVVTREQRQDTMSIATLKTYLP